MLLAVIGLHLAAIWWLVGNMDITESSPAERSDPDAAVSVSLHRARMPQAAAPARANAEPAAVGKKGEPPPAEPVAPEGSMPPTAPSSSGTRGVRTEANSADSRAPVSSRHETTDEGTQPRTVSRVSAPPSARLSYDLHALRKGQAVHGRGLLDWRNKGVGYSLEGKSSLLFLTVFSFRSEGTITAENGVSPALYTEKRFRKPETNTHFHRERNLVSFSASTRSYARKGGEQDRSSVVWQLAGAGRQDGQAFRQGARFAVFVAGARDAETWTFSVVGLEEIESGIGRLKAWHLARKPRADSYEQRLDVWLAPEREWYPVKLRYTDRNGDFLDMTVSAIEPPSH